MKASQYYFKWVSIILVATLLFTIWCTSNIYFMDEKELFNYAHTSTDSSSKGTGLVLYLLYENFGRVGVYVYEWAFVVFFFLVWLDALKERKHKKIEEEAQKQEEDAIKKREQEKLVQLSKRKSWRKKQEQKRKKQEQKRNK